MTEKNTGPNTQQFSAEDVKQAGIKQYRSPRNSNAQPSQNVAVQVTALIVVAVVVLALIAGAVITILQLTGK